MQPASNLPRSSGRGMPIIQMPSSSVATCIPDFQSADPGTTITFFGEGREDEYPLIVGTAIQLRSTGAFPEGAGHDRVKIPQMIHEITPQAVFGISRVEQNVESTPFGAPQIECLQKVKQRARADRTARLHLS